MSEERSPEDSLTQKKQTRKDRLAAQLRENLKKRKTQARTRKDGDTKPVPNEEA
jgi:hypothetical protein